MQPLFSLLRSSPQTQIRSFPKTVLAKVITHQPLLLSPEPPGLQLMSIAINSSFFVLFCFRICIWFCEGVEMMRIVSCKWSSIVIWLLTSPDDNPSFRVNCVCCISIALYGVPSRNHLTEFNIISICSCYDLAQLRNCLYVANVIWNCREQWDKRINRNHQIKLTITKG